METHRLAMAGPLPPGFVWLEQLCPAAVIDLRYATARNFTGQPLRGYESGTAAVTRQAAEALARACEELAPLGLTLKVFDAYRPQRAVRHMVEWIRQPEDLRSRSLHHPRVPKSQLLARGYIAESSEHSRGSAVDVTLVATRAVRPRAVEGDLLPNGEVDMGSPFDFFDPQSATDFDLLPRACITNRRWLRALMARHGFRNHPEEWWHFALRDEPFPDQSFDFPLPARLMALAA